MSSDWATSALSWWREAGVDVIVGEAPRDWLAPAPAVRESPAPFAAAPAAAAAAPAAAMPDTLDAFQAWLLASDQLPFASRTAPRVGPSGDPGSGLMILVDMPAAADVAAGSLLSGEAGELFDRMMAAIGRSRETLYLAPLSPYRTPSGQLDPAGAARLAEIARHHIGLVAPQALLLFGDACAKALLGAAVDQTRGKWHEVDTKSGKIRTLVTIRPEKLVSQAGLKKFAWEDLQVLREGLKS
ncbi:MAG: uracil-DNA glycosylase family protein [Allosphingosinicella sp.]